MITNHSYLDNPTFRGMRQSLMHTFDDIYILDLHGNSLKKEVCPDGSPDNNVFDIRQGVAIAFFVKRGGKKKADAVVQHHELHGTREAKNRWLTTHDRKKTKWKKLKPASPFYLFQPRDETHAASYATFPSVQDIFPLNGAGMTTARDGFVIDFEKSSLLNRVRQFKHSKCTDAALHKLFQISRKKGWNIGRAQKSLQQLANSELTDRVVQVLYRPFDVRFIFYDDSLVWRTVKQIMRHMLAGENLALLLPKRVEHVGSWQHAFATDAITDHVAVSLKTIDYHFPLYLYTDTRDAEKPQTGRSRGTTMMLFEPEARYGAKKPNLNPTIVSALANAYGKEPTPEDIFYYTYAVLYAPAYRKKYAEFLRMDFPRIPFTADKKLFAKLAKLGEKLAGLHLLKSPDLDPPVCRFEGDGDGRIGKDRRNGLRYDADERRVYINAAQYFAPVPEAVWKYQIGGYQVCGKWLKDRRERTLAYDDIRNCRIVSALAHTIEIQEEIDGLYAGVEENDKA